MYQRAEVPMMSEGPSTLPYGAMQRRAPAKVKWAIAGLWFETALGLVGLVGVLTDARSLASHGQEGAGQLVAVGLVAIVPVIAIWGWCAVAATRRVYWVRLVAAILQIVFILAGLITLIVALALQDPIGIAIATVLFLAIPTGIALAMLARDSREWYGTARRPTLDYRRR